MRNLVFLKHTEEKIRKNKLRNKRLTASVIIATNLILWAILPHINKNVITDVLFTTSITLIMLEFIPRVVSKDRI